MFVDLTDNKMNAHDIDALIKRERDANDGVLSPEFAMDILSKTNHFANIKKLVKTIKEKCEDERGVLNSEQVLPYKEFILSCVDCREMSDVALKDLGEMADACGIRAEFDEIHKKGKLFNTTDCQVVEVYSLEDLDTALEEGKLVVASISPSASVTNIIDKDFSRVRRLKVSSSNPICLIDVKNLPPEMDFSNCSFVDIRNSDFSRVNSFCVKDKSCVKMVDCSNIKGKWDLSKVFELHLSGSDFSKAEELKLGEISFAHGTTLPEVVDVTSCNDFYVDEKVNYDHVKTCILTRWSSVERSILDTFYGRGVKLIYANDKGKSENIQEEENNVKKKSGSSFFGRLFGRGIND